MYIGLVQRWSQLREQQKPSPIVVGDNNTRSVLNTICQQLRHHHGEIEAPHQYGPLAFAVGDEVIARHTDRYMRSNTGDFVRNGATGTVTATGPDAVVVNFDGIGQVALPAPWITQDFLNLSYALTSYAVQGATQATSTSLLTTGAQQAQLLVNITRGRTDNHIAVIAPTDSELSHWRGTDSQDIKDAVAQTVRPNDSVPAIVAELPP